ncbi:MAG: phosphoribosylformylglycinamidine synthase [Proteobacteria bacterium]|nr:phosphoribosylformylglycinamidine synthase [Pseudomonadota bacterium]
MAHRIEIALKPNLVDAVGEKVKRRIGRDLHLPVDQVRTISIYTVDADLSQDELEGIASDSYRDPISQDYAIDTPLASNFDWLVEVGFKPGVTDNVGKTATEVATLRLGRSLGKEERVYTSTQYVISGRVSRAQIERIATALLGNSLIQQFSYLDRKGWEEGARLHPVVPKVEGKDQHRVEKISLEVDDDTLLAISRERLLALDLDEMKAIQAYMTDPRVRQERKLHGLDGRVTDVEIEALAQTWSEHCKHKIFNALITCWDEDQKETSIDSLFDTFVKGATEKIRRDLGERDWCLSVFHDNAGVVEFNEDYSLVFKVETHNTPSALDPYGGALTGIVGVNRDPFGTGKGARLIFNTDVFCFASPEYQGSLPPKLFHPRRVLEGVREGVEHGGNKSGVPTVNGSIVFDDRFVGKPLVFCGTGGIIPRKILGEESHIKRVDPGDLIVMVGGRIGKDGIHGATFSSEELHEQSPTAAVQIGDPITQKKMTDFLLTARDRGLYKAITDNGAGGLSSSVGETASHIGCELHVDKAPLKYAGLDPWEILLSEAQERMTLAVAPEKIDEFLRLSRLMDVESTVLGTFVDTGRFHILYKGKTVGLLSMEFLHHGLPRMQLEARWKPPVYQEPSFPVPKDLTQSLFELLGRWNVCSKESVIRQYDHEVQGGSVVKPLGGAGDDGPNDAAVVRPVLESTEGVVVSHGICPKYGDIDTYWMVACAIDEAVRNAICVGARPDRMAGLDNFCWCDPIQSERTPDGHFKLAQLVRANQALYDYATAYNIPLISGKDSMKNDAMLGGVKISIPPTVLFSIIGKIDDVRKAMTADCKSPHDLVYVLGTTRTELGGSEYFASRGFVGNHVPRVNHKEAIGLYTVLHRTIEEGVLASCHDCSDGGLAVALAETAFSGALGLTVDLGKVPAEGVKRDDFLLFAESQSRFVVTVHPEKREAFEKTLSGHVYGQVGVVREDDRFEIIGLGGERIIRTQIGSLKEAWQGPLGSNNFTL